MKIYKKIRNCREKKDLNMQINSYINVFKNCRNQDNFDIHIKPCTCHNYVYKYINMIPARGSQTKKR